MKNESMTAEIYTNGKIIYRNEHGKLHNENGPAVVWPDGGKDYYINGELHNENGPAVVESDGKMEFWVNGNLHNENGPAVVWPDGHEEHWMYDFLVSKAEFKAWKAKKTIKTN